MTKKDEAVKLARAAPPLSVAELDAINSAYTAYIFRDRKKREVWTTCCGRHEMIPKQEYTDAQYAVMTAKHCPEDAGRENYYSYAQRLAAEGDRRTTTPCPYCGKDAYVKEIGRTGKRDNLAAYKRLVVFRWHRGALWASAYYTFKIYDSISRLTDKPGCDLYKVYRFRPGEAVCASRSHYWHQNIGDFCNTTTMKEPPKKLPMKFYEPFSCSYEEGMGYTIIGTDEISKSPFRYCQHEKYFKSHSSYMRFMAACCIWPRQVEMLMKCGLDNAVDDLAEGRRWNAAAFHWAEADPLKSFQLDKNETKSFLSGDKNLEALGYYKQFRRLGISCCIHDIEEMMRFSPPEKIKAVVKRLKACKMAPHRWAAYIQSEVDRTNGTKKTNPKTRQDIAQYWIDYVDAAMVLGYDLKNPIMSAPRELIKKHDAAVEAAAPVIAAKLTKRQSEKEAKRREEATRKYEFSFEDYVIRAPISAQDIINEGKALKHCVGGYAERHVNGRLTILFLRKANQPFKPLVTIEMKGSKLVQIHGYNNDIGSKVPSRKKYAEILDPWLEWVEAGSKRDKNGEPVTKKKRQTQISDSVADSA